MDQKIASAYNQAAAQLQELRDAHAQAGKDAKFREKLAAFRTQQCDKVLGMTLKLDDA